MVAPVTFSPDLRSVLDQEINQLLEKLENWDGRELGDALIRSISARVRMGFGVSADGGERERFNPLKPATVYKRTKMKAAGTLSPLTRPNTSNQTMTGHMINSLSKKTSPGTLEIVFDNQFAENKAKWNEAMGRPFMYLTRQEVKQILQHLKAMVRR